MLNHDAIDCVHFHHSSLYVFLNKSENTNQPSPSLQYVFKVKETPFLRALFTDYTAILAKRIAIVRRHNYPSSKDGKRDVNCSTHGHDSRKRYLTFHSKKKVYVQINY